MSFDTSYYLVCYECRLYLKQTLSKETIFVFIEVISNTDNLEKRVKDLIVNNYETDNFLDKCCIKEKHR